jgi:hypothetical protein
MVDHVLAICFDHMICLRVPFTPQHFHYPISSYKLSLIQTTDHNQEYPRHDMSL